MNKIENRPSSTQAQPLNNTVRTLSDFQKGSDHQSGGDSGGE
jgi:hypothetical protein